jgi:predicted XRE-type DNA-binding protein
MFDNVKKIFCTFCKIPLDIMARGCVCSVMAKITIQKESKVFGTLEARRRALNASQADIARILGVSRATYINWVKRGTSEFNVKRISNALATYQKEHL